MRSNRGISSWNKTERFTESRHSDKTVRTNPVGTVRKISGYSCCFACRNFERCTPDWLA